MQGDDTSIAILFHMFPLLSLMHYYYCNRKFEADPIKLN